METKIYYPNRLCFQSPGGLRNEHDVQTKQETNKTDLLDWTVGPNEEQSNPAAVARQSQQIADRQSDVRLPLPHRPRTGSSAKKRGSQQRYV